MRCQVKRLVRKNKNNIKIKKIEAYNEVLFILRILTGATLISQKTHDRYIVETGVKYFNYKLFSRGDCGRLAYLLYSIFHKKYDTKIYRIQYKIWKDTEFHYVTKIYDKYFDVFGEYIIYNSADKVLTEINLDDEKYYDELTGTYTIGRLFGEIMCSHAFPLQYYDIKTSECLQRRTPKLPYPKKDNENYLINSGDVGLMMFIFDKVFNNKNISIKDMWQSLEDILDNQLFKPKWLTQMVVKSGEVM